MIPAGPNRDDCMESAAGHQGVGSNAGTADGELRLTESVANQIASSRTGYELHVMLSPKPVAERLWADLAIRRGNEAALFLASAFGTETDEREFDT